MDIDTKEILEVLEKQEVVTRGYLKVKLGINFDKIGRILDDLKKEGIVEETSYGSLTDRFYSLKNKD